MLILGISTSSKNPSAAVMKDYSVIAYCCDRSGRSHSATLMGLVDNVLTEANIKVDELNYIAVDVGPGSFTGVRIGVSAANAIAYTVNAPLIPVSSLAALRNIAGNDDIVCAMIDCRNGNGYAAVYNKEQELLSPCPCIIDEVIASLPVGAVIVGDCNGNTDYPDARLVLQEAATILNNNQNAICSEAHPLYLRPSQAERIRANQHSPHCDT